ncbi:hypothetical protein [Pseudomonas viridiflava]|uniref:hypothetical protein n=1 Tax=Pseudomonas viridiflava TaxID=33069 RepID=UPI000F0315BA|nr:hypothetical protein [Pseudomonas viridiflava]
MARNFAVGDTVFVPASRLPDMGDIPSVFWKTEVAAVNERSIKVSLRNGDFSDWIGASACHKNIGILLFTVGDLETEKTLLDPLAKSILQYCRILVPDDQLLSFKIRSIKELSDIWNREQAAYSHVVLVGHGSHDGFKFANDGWCGAKEMQSAFTVPQPDKKIFISLCCQTGHQTVGGALSKMDICSHFIAPFQSVHGAVASQFTQTFLAYHLLEGQSSGVAFRHAIEGTPGTKNFRLWERGVLKGGPKR